MMLVVICMNLVGLRLAHRGMFLNPSIPENSLLSFKRAIDYRIPIELDVTLTKDLVPVVFHDGYLKRMTGKNRYMEEVTLEELKRYILLSTKEKIPTLKEVLALVQGRVLIDIEIKSTKHFKVICQKILEDLSTYQGDIFLQSFHPGVVRYLKKHSPYPVGLLITYLPSSKFYSYLFRHPLLIRYTRPDFLAVHKKIVSKKRIQTYRKQYPIFVWTIESFEEYQKLLPYADSYLCNHLPY